MSRELIWVIALWACVAVPVMVYEIRRYRKRRARDRRVAEALEAMKREHRRAAAQIGEGLLAVLEDVCAPLAAEREGDE